MSKPDIYFSAIWCYFFLSDFNYYHRLSVGSACPGETVIDCQYHQYDYPNLNSVMSYTNVEFESITAYLIIESYEAHDNIESWWADVVFGIFHLEWKLSPKGIFVYFLHIKNQ